MIKNILIDFLKQNKLSYFLYFISLSYIPISKVGMPHLYGKLIGSVKKLNMNSLNPTKHVVDLNFLIAMPALMLALVLTAACFCVKLFRVQHSIFMIILGIIVGLLLFFVNHISYILSENEIFNPILGAWWHIITAILIATKVLISREDG